METRRLLWVMALVFSVVLLVQYIELPYGYVLQSLLSFGKAQVTSAGSLLTKGSSSDTGNLTNQIGLSGVNSTKMDAVHEFRNMTKLLDQTNEDDKHDLKSETSNRSDDSLGIINDPEDDHPSRDFLRVLHNSTDEGVAGNKKLAPEKAGEHGYDLPVSRYTSANNASLNNLQATNAVPSSIKNDDTISPMTSPQMASPPPNSPSDISSPEFIGRNQSPHIQSSGQFILAETTVAFTSRERITERKNTDRECRNYGKEPSNYVKNCFTRSYELMEQTLKIYIYTEGERPIFHQPELYGIYASEGWFMKLLEENKHFVTGNANKAHLFYLPFSSRILEETLYVPDSHSRKNLVQYLSSYLQNITTTYPFWNRTSGADHFLVACHDWAPAETSRIMKNCIRALCNADVKGGFQFGKDVSLPEIYVRNASNPLKNLGGKPPSQRRILAFFAGHMHGYLRPILLNYWENKDPDMKIFGKLRAVKGQMTYIQYMKSSKYCISAKGYEPYTPSCGGHLL
ncbi:UNVERIFIED_CONTAM: putative glycosyltransferase [Sesamum radiatum]|uniref:Glycosyltransferase n=1 Tax=Sesamum radiatum TaxID=300843 RepID=A0AAW2KZK8_SESRA